jgi:plastocyanin|tara:strand:- start:344 stop:718 length:375 start_codon:yes stop_codon:yes gene_type:complete
MKQQNLKHEIMWWMSRLTIMLTSLFLSFTLAASAWAAEIQMGANGNLIFEPNDLTVNVGDTVTFTNGDLPPHNMVFNEYPELSHPDLAFTAGESFNVTFDKAGEYEFQCEPHAGAGMKGVIHVK